jgi:aminoglycoside phosphotransferase (APT) family kinase protein
MAKADAELSDRELEGLARSKRELVERLGEQLAEGLAEILGVERVSIAPLPDRGTFHAVFRVASPSGELFARTGVPGVPWPALDFGLEAWAARALPSRGIPVPPVLHVDLSRERLPVDLLLAEAARGHALPPGPGAAGAARSLGACLARLHRVGAAGAGPIDPGSLDPGSPERGTPTGLHPAWSHFLLLRLDEHLEVCRDQGALSANDLALLERAFARHAPRLDAVPVVLLHGDLGNPNVLVEGGRVTALLDWEDALAGDPMFDLAGRGTFVGNHERREALLEGYLGELGAAGPGEDFELRYRLYCVRILLAKTVHRHRFGYSRTDRIPAADRLRPAVAALAESLEREG